MTSDGTPAAERSGFAAFYPGYLADHTKPSTRVFHVLGTLGLIRAAGIAIAAFEVRWCVFGIALAYAAAWGSHFFLERNRPATFRRPLYSIAADFRMTFELLTRRRRFDERVPGSSEAVLDDDLAE